jgi:PTH1 family peptidyl-tRNA hydrolase
MVTDHLRSTASRASGWEPRFGASLARAEIAGLDVTLLEPQTFMNRSGRAVREAVTGLSLAADDLLVVHDDLDLAFGAVRVKVGGGAGGHRGLRSCFEELGTRDFARVRVGIGRPAVGASATDYVLEPFDETQRTDLPELIARAAEAARETLGVGAVAAMNRFNRRIIEDGGEP